MPQAHLGRVAWRGRLHQGNHLEQEVQAVHLACTRVHRPTTFHRLPQHQSGHKLLTALLTAARPSPRSCAAKQVSEQPTKAYQREGAREGGRQAQCTARKVHIGPQEAQAKTKEGSDCNTANPTVAVSLASAGKFSVPAPLTGVEYGSRPRPMERLGPEDSSSSLSSMLLYLGLHGKATRSDRGTWDKAVCRSTQRREME